MWLYYSATGSLLTRFSKITTMVPISYAGVNGAQSVNKVMGMYLAVTTTLADMQTANGKTVNGKRVSVSAASPR